MPLAQPALIDVQQHLAAALGSGPSGWAPVASCWWATVHSSVFTDANWFCVWSQGLEEVCGVNSSLLLVELPRVKVHSSTANVLSRAPEVPEILAAISDNSFWVLKSSYYLWFIELCLSLPPHKWLPVAQPALGCLLYIDSLDTFLSLLYSLFLYSF